MKENKASRRARSIFALAAMLFAMIIATTLVGCGGNSESAHRSDSWKEGAGEAQAALNALKIDTYAMDFDYTDREQNPTYDDATSTHILFSGESAVVEGGAGGAATDGAIVTINTSGTYVVNGEGYGGQVVVDAADIDKVQLVLAGVNLTNESAPAIYIKNADKTFITLADGTENVISDGNSNGYALDDDGDELDAVIFGRDDIAFNGNGSLSVTANYKDGIAGKDDVVFCNSGTYVITAADDGIRCKDSVKFQGGVFTITTDGDGIKSTKDDAPDKGYVVIDGGSFDIASEGKGISAQTVFMMNGGAVLVNAGDEGVESEQVFVNGGELTITSDNDGINATARNTVKDLLEQGATDEGAIDIAPANEPKKAERGGAPEKGDMVEGSPADMPDKPDGNAPGEPSEMSESMKKDLEHHKGGAAASSAYSDCLIEFNGGVVSVASVGDGDGIDSNGSIVFNGGDVVIEGSAVGSEDAMDYEYCADINGGNVLLVGQIGMSQGFTSGTQAFVSESVSDYEQGNVVVVELRDAGSAIIGSEVGGAFTQIIASCPAMQDGGAYELVINNIVMATVSAIVSGGQA